MIDISLVHRIFNKGKANQVNAVNGISLHIDSGEFVVIVGSNGSGKTTLLNLVAGSVLPSSGSISIDGNDVTKLPDYKRSEWIARVFQNPLSGTASDLSILDNFRLAAIRTKTKGLSVGINDQFKKQVKEKIATLGMGLENKLDQPIGTLSGGQRQALTLLMSVMDTCRVLLLDEPTAALDPHSANVVMQTEITDVVKNLFAGADERDWEKVKSILADHVVLDYGALSGGAASVLTPDQIINAWKGLLPGFDITHHQPANFLVKQNGGAATVHYFAKADHFLNEDKWTVEANYDTDLVKTVEGWKINSHKISNVKQSGNENLPAKAMEIVKTKSK